jgi:hypothetical protein
MTILGVSKILKDRIRIEKLRHGILRTLYGKRFSPFQSVFFFVLNCYVPL